MTESIDIAVHYSIRKSSNNCYDYFSGSELKKTYVFVNQVSNPTNLKTEKYESYHTLRQKYAAPKHPFCKNVHQNSPDRIYKVDTEGRFHKMVPGLSLLDEYVADDSLVKPRFLIEIEQSGTDHVKYLNLIKFLLNRIK